jgi:very-short-patch-repair endonuclease
MARSSAARSKLSQAAALIGPVDERALDAIGATQYGYATRPQLLALMSARQIELRLHEGRLISAHPGIYRIGGAPVTPRGLLYAACMAGGDGAVASHRSAAGLWRLRGVAPGAPEITVPSPRWTRVRGTRVHRSDRLDPGFLTVAEGILVTIPARTLFDLSAVLTPYVVERAVDDALRRKLMTIEELRRCYIALTRRGRRKSTVIRAILEDRLGDLEGAESAGEREVARALRAAGYEPVPQYQVVAGGAVYVLDFAFPPERVGLEWDGWAVHGTRTAFDHDRRRDNALRLAGWTILRFGDRTPVGEVVRTTDAALRLCRARTPYYAVERGKIAG